ncbi:MAG: Hpt domain-containing protein [Planctomycetaceae bacterium]|jgi:HPt (histidine-containing phosphotransfer) domain-containing protein|nr:Hpt domain-containing protein [Planctomycetaceae bacterium]
MSDFPFSLENVLEQCGGSTVTVVSVLNEFLNQVPTDEAEMLDGFNTNTLITTSKAAHRLKGTAGVLGADKLHTLCAALEIAAKENRAEDAKKIFADLQAETKKCISYVPDALKNLQ